MREVLKWSKNYETGEEKEVIAFKDSHELIGRANIKVFGANGELKQEVFTENLIPTWLPEFQWYRDLYQSIINGNYGMGVSGVPTSFGKILLSTCEEEENKDNITVKGDIIGWCPKKDTNPGSDKRRGTYNPNESFEVVEDDRYMHYHLVYDFGTSQANGTFNSVFWGRTVKYEDVDAPMYFYKQEYLHPKVNLDGNIRVNVDGELVKSIGDKWYPVKNMLPHINRLEPVKTGDIPIAKFINSKYKVNDGYAMVENTKFTQLDTSLNINSMTCSIDLVLYNLTHEKQKTITINCIDVMDDVVAVIRENPYKYDNIRYESHYINWRNGDMYLKFYAYNELSKFPSVNATGVTAETGVKTFTCRGIYNIFTETWKIKPSCRTWESRNTSAINYASTYKTEIENIEYLHGNEGYGSLARIKDNDYNFCHKSNFSSMFSESSYDSSMYKLDAYIPEIKGFICYANLFRILPYSAHTKLPNPVVKTAADTMKIQYDYYVQIPITISLDGDFITPPTEIPTKEE